MNVNISTVSVFCETILGQINQDYWIDFFVQDQQKIPLIQSSFF